MESGVAEKCLAFCQALTSSNQKFSLSLSIGQDNFNFCNKDLVTSSVLKKKKKSPSQIRREAKRKLERHQKENPEDTVKVFDGCSMSKCKGVSDFEEATCFKCPECELSFKTEKLMKIHIGKSHKSETLSTSEKERSTSPTNMSLALSPIQGTRDREEQEQDSGQLICTECSDLWGPPTAACSTASSREEQEKWKTLCSKCWTIFTTCPDYYRFIKY